MKYKCRLVFKSGHTEDVYCDDFDLKGLPKSSRKTPALRSCNPEHIVACIVLAIIDESEDDKEIL